MDTNTHTNDRNYYPPMSYFNALLETRHRKSLYFDENTVNSIYTNREKAYFDALISALEKCVELEKLNKNRVEEE